MPGEIKLGLLVYGFWSLVFSAYRETELCLKIPIRKKKRNSIDLYPFVFLNGNHDVNRLTEEKIILDG